MRHPVLRSPASSRAWSVKLMRWASVALLAVNHINTRNACIVRTATMSRIPENWNMTYRLANTDLGLKAPQRSSRPGRAVVKRVRWCMRLWVCHRAGVPRLRQQSPTFTTCPSSALVPLTTISLIRQYILRFRAPPQARHLCLRPWRALSSTLAGVHSTS